MGKNYYFSSTIHKLKLQSNFFQHFVQNNFKELVYSNESYSNLLGQFIGVYDQSLVSVQITFRSKYLNHEQKGYRRKNAHVLSHIMVGVA